MRIFLVRPIRNAGPGQISVADNYCRALESLGHEVYDPLRDTDQKAAEISICLAHRYAIQRADEVHVVWDGLSQGVLFDLGMAFALQKPIRAVGVTPKAEKSFENLLWSLSFHCTRLPRVRLFQARDDYTAWTVRNCARCFRASTTAGCHYHDDMLGDSPYLGDCFASVETAALLGFPLSSVCPVIKPQEE